jgi:lipoprotein LpqH
VANLRKSSAAVAAVGLIACGCTGSAEPSPIRGQDASRITVGDQTLTVQSLTCSQVQWLLTIKAAAGPGRVTAMVQLDGEKPTVETVNIENFDGFSGISGEYVDGVHADVSFADGAYTITGSAQRSSSDNANLPKTAQFRIEGRCERITAG